MAARLKCFCWSISMVPIPPSPRTSPSTMVSIIHPMAAFWRMASKAAPIWPRITTSHTTRQSPMRSVRAWSSFSVGTAATMSTIEVSRKAEMPNTSSASFSACPPLNSRVNTKVKPTRLRKRALVSAVTMGRSAGTTLR